MHGKKQILNIEKTIQGSTNKLCRFYPSRKTNIANGGFRAIGWFFMYLKITN